MQNSSLRHSLNKASKLSIVKDHEYLKVNFENRNWLFQFATSINT